MDVIEKLKNNLAVLSNLLKEEQEIIFEARHRGKAEFLDDFGLWVRIKICTDNPIYDYRYRLTSDYQPEPKIVECIIYEKDDLLLFNYKGDETASSYAVNIPNFVGYKYEDGTIRVWARFGSSTKEVANIPTHVLFKEK